MNEFVNYWMKQPYEHRLAARFGTFPLNQPELPIEWENPSKPLTISQAAIILVLEPLEEGE